MKLVRKKTQIVKPNLIPILDAVFIFIFFLLMSAQFLEIYEIGSDAPAIKTYSDDKPLKEKPLNLTLVIGKDFIQIKTGLEEKTVETIGLKNGNYDLKKLTKVLTKLKANHIEEDSIVLKPQDGVEYKKVVYIIDSAREIPAKAPILVGKTKAGKEVKTRNLFSTVIFETQN